MNFFQPYPFLLSLSHTREAARGASSQIFQEFKKKRQHHASPKSNTTLTIVNDSLQQVQSGALGLSLVFEIVLHTSLKL